MKLSFRLLAAAIVLAPTSNPQVQSAIAQQVPGASAVIKQAAVLQGQITDELLKRTIGAAEGNLTANGTRNPNFYGHTDPGDDRHNIGTFSYSASRDGTNITDPEEADRHYLQVIKSRAVYFKQRVANAGIKLTLEEELNGWDLLNQAPACVIDGAEEAGYVARLVAAKKRGLTGRDAIVDARTESFSTDPESVPPSQRRYQTTFLSKEWLSKDQRRRAEAIAETMQVVFAQQGNESPVSFNPDRDLTKGMKGANEKYVSTARRQ